MTKTETSYAELSKKVGDAVLFNSHSEVDEDWVYGLIESPHITDALDALDIEAREAIQKDIDASKDEGEKAKLTEELDKIERHNIYDLAEGSIYQTYAITSEGARYLFNHTSELISYSEKLGLYLWHITHYGTSWTGVHTTVYDWATFEETPEWYAYSDADVLKHTVN